MYFLAIIDPFVRERDVLCVFRFLIFQVDLQVL